MEVNVYDLQGIYGLTIPTKFYPAVPGKQRRASCSISIDNNYSSIKGFKDTPTNCMHVTVAHEFFHAVQYAYNVDADSWWKEATATWNEDEIYNEVNDYIRYLDQVLSSPEKPLDQSSYGGIIFAKYLSENYGGYNIIKSIWEAQGESYNTSVAVIDEVIRKKCNRGYDLGTAFKEYTARNYNPSQYYHEGHLWKSSVHIENIHASYPALLENGSLKHLASNYHLFKSSDNNSNHIIKIILEGSKDIKLGFKVLQRKRIDDLCHAEEIAIEKANNRVEVILTGLGKTYKEICLIVSNPHKKLDDAKYKYLVVKE